MNRQLFNRGFASTTISALGHNPNNFTRLVSQSFSTGTQVAPYPLNDRFSASVGVFFAGHNDHVILFTQPPELLEWHKQHHLDPTVKIHEMNFSSCPDFKSGYPYGSINYALLKNKTLLKSLNAYGKEVALITTFPDNNLRSQAEKNNIKILQKSDSSLVNSKPFFHECSFRFGYETCPSYIVRNIMDIPLAVRKLRRFHYGVWVKYNGSGGDTVIKLDKLTEQNLKTAIAKIVAIINNTFLYGNFNQQEKNNLIESTSLIPHTGIVVEADVRNFGKIIVNGSNVVYTNKEGLIKVLDYASQITYKGFFLGSRNLVDDDRFTAYLQKRGIKLSTIIDKLDKAAKSVARLAQLSEYMGIHGQDFFIIETPTGEIKIINTELNGRISNTGVARFAATQAGVDHFLTLDIKRRSDECNTLKDFETMVTVNRVNYLSNDPQQGAVWPMAFNARWNRNKHGDCILEKSSSGVRVVILAKDKKMINHINDTLDDRWKIQ